MFYYLEILLFMCPMEVKDRTPLGWIRAAPDSWSYYKSKVKDSLASANISEMIVGDCSIT